MPVKREALPRTFTIKRNGQDIALADPNPSMTPEQVMVFYSAAYTELTTSTVTGPRIDGTRLAYEFRTTVGTKG